MDKREAIEKAIEFAEIVKKKYNPEKIVLFGSYIKGTYNENSDIDIAVIVNKINGDFLSEISKLYKMRRNIETGIEPVLLENDDNKSGFLGDILKNGKILYSK